MLTPWRIGAAGQCGMVALIFLAVVGVSTPVLAQGRGAGADSVTPRMEAGVGTPALRVFVDCGRYCDSEYLRIEIPWVTYVRDRADADVHVLVTQLGAGGGGQAYTVNLVGLGIHAGQRDTLRFLSPPGAASDAVRSGLTRTIALGLIPFVSDSPVAAGLTISYSPPTDGGTRQSHDPWNAWVFRLGASGSLSDEQRQEDRRIQGEVSARRVTAAWKVGASARADVRSDRYELDDRTVRNRRDSYDMGAVVVRSFGAHWGAGVEGSVGSSTFDNMKRAVRVAPAVEYSFYPYSEATRRQFTLQYSLGVSAFRYHEETIFDRMSETRPTQALVAGYDVRQPWGSADATLEAANYLDDLAKHSLRFRGSLDIRLVRGLELNVGGSASLVRDQLALVKRDASEEEILLRRRALATSYRYSLRAGLSYTFGSIYSSVVNPRFGSGPGRILR